MTLSHLENDAALTFGTALRQIRQSRNLNVRGFARMLSISKSTLSRWENDDLPDAIDQYELQRIRHAASLTDEELLVLVKALGCSLLRERGIF